MTPQYYTPEKTTRFSKERSDRFSFAISWMILCRGKFLACILAAMVVLPAITFGQNVLKAVDGKVSFFSQAPLEDIYAVSHQVNSFINKSTGEIVFIIPMRSFDFEKDLMEEHFNEKYIESDKYPNATYKGKIEGEIDFSVPGTYSLTSSGLMGIHGKEKMISEGGTIRITQDTVFLDTKFRVAIADYDIAIPKLLIKNIADTVEVTLNASYMPYITEK